MDPESVALKIKKSLDISATDTLLEVGCGCGYLGEQLMKVATPHYQGIEKSKNLCDIAQKTLDVPVECTDAANLPFDDNSFDYVVVYSIMQYFPDREYADRAIAELKRVARKGVYVGDVVIESHDESHTTFPLDYFKSDWVITTGTYSDKRYDMHRDCYVDEEWDGENVNGDE